MVAGGGKSAEGSRRSRDKSAQWPRIQSWQNQAVMPGWSPPALEGHRDDPAGSVLPTCRWHGLRYLRVVYR